MVFNYVNKRDTSIEDSHNNLLDQSYSVVWRLLHGTCYQLGGLTFICGSCMYFANVISNNSQALLVGAWLFIVGSTCFLLADLQDWFYYRIGLFLSAKTRTTDRADLKQRMFFDRCRHITIDLNYFASIVGSILYLVGSVFFLPQFADKVIAGDILFITGSAVIYLSEGWKIYRLACTNSVNPKDTAFRCENILRDLQALLISTFAGLGGVFYFIGTILFLPQYTQTDFGENRAAGLYVCGGIFFTLAGLFLQYRYYCSSRK